MTTRAKRARAKRARAHQAHAKRARANQASDGQTAGKRTAASTTATTKSTTTKPATAKPTTTKPTTTKRPATSTTTTKPATTAKPVITAKPVTTQPVTTKPVTTKPVTTKPATTTRPVSPQPTTTTPDRADQADKGAAPKPGDNGILVTWRESPIGVKALLAGIFVNRLGSFVQIFLVLFLTTRGFTTVQAGFALGCYATGSVVGVIIGGTLTDRLGPRRTILLSMSGTGVLILAIFYLTYLPALLGTVAVVGAVGGAYRPASKMLMSELTPSNRQVMIFAMYRLAYNLGTTAAPLIGAALVAISYSLLFWGEALAAFAYVVIAAIALPKHRRVSEAAGPSEDGKARASGYLAVLADRRFSLFLLATLINSVVYVQYLSTLPVAMREAGLGTTWFGAMVALNGFIVITCELLVTKVVQRIPMRMVVAAGFLLLGGGLACYALPFGAAVFVIGTLIWTLAEIVAGPTMFAYPAVAGPEHLRGRYLGASTAMFGIGAAIGPIAGLTVWNVAGPGVWLWCGVVCLAGVAIAWYGMRPPEPEVPAPDDRTETRATVSTQQTTQT